MGDKLRSGHLPAGAQHRMFLHRQQLARFWQEYQWFVLGGLWLAAGCLGYIGFSKYFAALGEPRPPGTLLYLTLQLFVLESGAVAGSLSWELEAARLLAPTVAAYTAVQALALLFYEQVHLLRLRFVRNHIVICGLGHKGLLLAQGFQASGHQVVVIDLNEDNSLIDQCRELGAIVLIGDATRPDLLSQSRIHLARHAFALTGDDGVNAEIAVCAHELVAQRRGPALTCIVHIVDPQLCDLLREQELVAGRVTRFRLQFFNVFDSGARAVLNQYPPFDHEPERQPHLLVVGLGQMGESLVVHTAQRWWARYAATNRQLRLSIIDRDAEQKVESLAWRYPLLRTACNLRPLAMEIRGPDFDRGSFFQDPEGCCDVTIAYVCLDDDSLALSAALNLQQRMRGEGTPIVVRMRRDGGLATLLGGLGTDERRFESLHAFALLDRTCTPDLVLGGTHEVLARSIHDRYLQTQRRAGATVEENPSLVPWQLLPEGLKESNRRQADHIGTKLRATGCRIVPLTDWNAELFRFKPHEIEVMARMEQERWVQQRRDEGWTHAATKDVEARTSPDLVSWEELSASGRKNCRDAVTDLPVFLARAGFQIQRIQAPSTGG